MTPQQMRNKIADLNEWLTNNPHHPNYNVVLNDKKCLELTLMNNENGKQ